MPVRYRLCSTVNAIKGQKIESPSDLAGHNCLHYGLRELGSEWRFQRAGEEARVRVTSNVVVNNSEVVRDLLLADMGIGLVWNYAVDREIADGRLIALLSEWTPVGPFGQTAYALWLPQTHLPPKIRVFVDFLAERLGDTPT
jgi:DNA-binding transcriptional LysR family regulator